MISWDSHRWIFSFMKASKICSSDERKRMNLKGPQKRDIEDVGQKASSLINNTNYWPLALEPCTLFGCIWYSLKGWSRVENWDFFQVNSYCDIWIGSYFGYAFNRVYLGRRLAPPNILIHNSPLPKPLLRNVGPGLWGWGCAWNRMTQSHRHLILYMARSQNVSDRIRFPKDLTIRIGPDRWLVYLQHWERCTSFCKVVYRYTLYFITAEGLYSKNNNSFSVFSLTPMSNNMTIFSQRF